MGEGGWPKSRHGKGRCMLLNYKMWTRMRRSKMLKILRTSFVNGSQGRGEREAAIQPTEMIYAPFTVARKGKNR